MRPVLGLALSEAEALLLAEGVRVKAVETSSRKGVPGGVPRVVRQREEADAVELVWSAFLDTAAAMDAEDDAE